MHGKGWELGSAVDFWSELEVPAGLHHNFIFDASDYNESYRLLRLLSKLSILEVGTVYEQFDCIRIKANIV